MVVVDLMQARDVPPVCDGDLGEVLLARHAGGEDHQDCGRLAVHLAEPVRRALRGMREIATAQASPDSCVVVLDLTLLDEERFGEGPVEVRGWAWVRGRCVPATSDERRVVKEGDTTGSSRWALAV